MTDLGPARYQDELIQAIEIGPTGSALPSGVALRYARRLRIPTSNIALAGP